MKVESDPPGRADPPAAQQRSGRTVREEGGDPVCWLAWTCQVCGAFVGADPPEKCPRCGDPLANPGTP